MYSATLKAVASDWQLPAKRRIGNAGGKLVGFFESGSNLLVDLALAFVVVGSAPCIRAKERCGC